MSEQKEIEIQLWSDKYDRKEKRHVPDKCLETKLVPFRQKGKWLTGGIPNSLHPPLGKFWLVIKQDGILHTVGDTSGGKGYFDFSKGKHFRVITSLAIQQFNN